MARDDREMFATFDQIVAQSGRVVSEHLDHLAAMLTQIIDDGIASGEFAATDPVAAGRAVLHATARFHHPAHTPEWADHSIEADLDAVLSVLLHGLLRVDRRS
jgi:Tetracyclin repressor-like, C-terminal domain